MIKRKTTLAIVSAIVLLTACGGGSKRYADIAIDPRDTLVVPEELTGEDSIAYIEDALMQSPISASDLLGLAEVHALEDYAYKYNDFERAKESPEYASEFLADHRDSAAMRLGNRFMRMANVVNRNGNAKDKLQWAIAVGIALDTFRVAVPSLAPDSTLEEVLRVMSKFSSETQGEMNMISYIGATIEYYRTIEAYRQWLDAVPENLKAAAQEEYEAWDVLNEARFTLWRDVTFRQEWYSMKPMEIDGYYENLAMNRLAELEVERDIVLKGKPYRQKGKTVTAAQWEKWIADSSVPEDLDFLKESEMEDYIPSDSLTAERVDALKSTFTRWIAARQAFAAALPEEQGRSYDQLTADIHSRIVCKLPLLVPYSGIDL